MMSGEKMRKKPYTPDEMRTFDRITSLLSSRDQMDLISGRMKLKTFIAEHGKEKCDAMFEVLKKARCAHCLDV